jgi:hypothetical protein
MLLRKNKSEKANFTKTPDERFSEVFTVNIFFTLGGGGGGGGGDGGGGGGGGGYGGGGGSDDGGLRW